MLKVFVGKKIIGLPLVLAYSKERVVEEVASIEEAEYLLIPHNWTHVKQNPGFLKQYEYPTKHTAIFCIGDSDEPVNFPNSIVFRTSQYKSAQLPNEIIMPTVVEDLGTKYGITTRAKGPIPSVGFVGWARQNGFAAFKSSVKNVFKSGPRKKGLYFRQRAISILENSALVQANFVKTSKYHAGTQDAFVKNMKDSDFALAPKGDGNYSGRFYEALSLGRLPVLIDTDCPLPLEDEIGYSKFVVRVPYNKMQELSERISSFYKGLSAEGFTSAQLAARRGFEEKLNITSYLKHVLTKEFLEKYAR